MKWIVENKIARSSRPGYPDRTVDAQTVQATVETWKRAGIASVLCLLDDPQLAYYDDLPGGLLHAYEAAGLAVGHVPVTDHQHPPLDAGELDAALQCFAQLPQPVLVHCSAGVDRTGQVVDALCQRLEEDA